MASELFHATLILLTLPDGGGANPPSWAIPNAPELISTVAGLMEAFRPELVLTFDPRHGTTCHPDHRAIGAVVLEAVKRLSFEPKLYLLETRIEIAATPFALRFTSATAAAERIDAKTTWNAIGADMRRHPSQFDDAWLTAVEQVPAEDRAVYIAPAESAMLGAVATCP